MKAVASLTIRFVAIGVLWTGAIAGSVGQLGRVVSPLDGLNHLMPIWVLGAAAAVAVLIAMRRALGAAELGALSIVLACGGLQMGPELFAAFARGGGPATGRDLRLVEFNVSKGNRTPERATAWILNQDADVVVLGEAPSYGLIVKALRRRYPHLVSCTGAQGLCSTVILSKRPPNASGGLAEGDPENRRGLSAAWARFDDGRASYVVVAVHLQRPWPFGDQAADRARLARFIGSVGSRQTIVAGDFNATPWSFALQDQDRAFELDRVSRAKFTWPTRAAGRVGLLGPFAPIDHVYAGPGWRPLAVRRGPFLGSDHLALVVDLTAAAPRSERPGMRG